MSFVSAHPFVPLDLKGTVSCYMVEAVYGSIREELRAVSQRKVSNEILKDGCLGQCDLTLSSKVSFKLRPCWCAYSSAVGRF